ncbi:MAG: Zn-ribbon domain-containing OB-fold protein [Gammaproteobacteria bacterium]
MTDPGRPLPRPDALTAPWFDALRRQRILLQYFPSCDRYQLPYSDRSQADLSEHWEWREAAGTGRVYSWAVTHQVYHPAFAAEVPYVVAVVELDEGPRLNTTLVNVDRGAIRCGMPVRVLFRELAPGGTVAVFEPA